VRPNVDYPDPEYARQAYADYYGVVSNVDWNVGRVLAALDSLGLATNTIVVLTSDHGDLLGSQYSRVPGFNFKGLLYTESLNVPFVLRYPARVAPTLLTDLFTSVDIMPTLLGLCGIAVPAGVMGRDFSRRLVWGFPPAEPPWGPVPSTNSALVGMFQGSWLGVHTAEYSLSCTGPNLTPKLFFHNTIDPYQLTNRVDDPDYQSVREDLLLELQAWLDYVEYA
jgi:arylsulfatase A-like enzyme